MAERMDTINTAMDALANSSPSGTGIFGSLKMDDFLQTMWDKDPSLLATIGSLTASFAAPDAAAAAGGGGGHGPQQAAAAGQTVRSASGNNGQMDLAQVASAAQEYVRQQAGQQQEQPRSQPPPPQVAGHHVVASTGFSIPSDYSGKTVDEVWSAIHSDAPVPPPSYDHLTLSNFLNTVGVRSVEETPPAISAASEQPPPPWQQLQAQQDRPYTSRELLAAVGVGSQQDQRRQRPQPYGQPPPQYGGANEQAALERELAYEQSQRSLLQQLAGSTAVAGGHNGGPPMPSNGFSSGLPAHPLSGIGGGGRHPPPMHAPTHSSALAPPRFGGGGYGEAAGDLGGCGGADQYRSGLPQQMAQLLPPPGQLNGRTGGGGGHESALYAQAADMLVGRATPPNGFGGRGLEPQLGAGGNPAAAAGLSNAPLHGTPIGNGHSAMGAEDSRPATVAAALAQQLQRQQPRSGMSEAAGGWERLQAGLSPKGGSPAGGSPHETGTPGQMPDIPSPTKSGGPGSTATATQPSSATASAAQAAAARAARQRKRKAPTAEGEATSSAQLRMVKNRESAARSRQRKQAYTTELEEQVEKLKEQNRALREKVIRACPAIDANVLRRMPEPKSLRRTRTDPS